MTMKRILAAVDGDVAASRAAHLALDMAHDLGASLTLLYVVPPVVVTGPEVPYAVLLDAQRKRGDEVLTHLREELHDTEIHTARVDGSAAEEIVRYADEGDFDLIVVGNNGKGAVERLLLGSVSDRTVHKCQRPVLVVH
jgi:nucleotide-binding universal stress UspA family protein